ncbi:hypothetical protein AGLY_016957 [Aphis glycines]|uniref:Uncharacterized protein n=1 Tax=Aphis glycines TaxID=307491 RepID=A0A6G0SWL3_APHGL|nr:hypothetical protein AGLY_016957 [Aphis glycines]
MTSLTKILILFIAVVTIGEVVDMHPDSNRPDVDIDELSESLVRLKMSATDYTNIDKWMMWLLRTRLESPQTSPPVETTTTKFVTNQHSGWRKRRQTLVKLRGGVDGSNSVVSLTSSSSPSNMNSNGINPNLFKIKLYNWILRNLETEAMKEVRKSVLKNRSRRSTEDAKMSSDKNTTEFADLKLTDLGITPVNALTCSLSLVLPIALPLRIPCVKLLLDSL